MITLDDTDQSIMSDVMSGKSPGAEQSGAEEVTDSGEEKLMEEDSDKTRDMIVFSPFLSKAGAKVVTVTTSSKESTEVAEYKEEKANESVKIIEKDEVEQAEEVKKALNEAIDKVMDEDE